MGTTAAIATLQNCNTNNGGNDINIDNINLIIIIIIIIIMIIAIIIMIIIVMIIMIIKIIIIILIIIYHNDKNYYKNQSINTEIIEKTELFSSNYKTVQLHCSFTLKTKLKNLFLSI